MMSSGLPEKVTLPEDAIDVLEGQPVLQEVLGPALSQMQTFHDRLSAEGLKRGLIGPRDTTIIWERHILNSAAIVPFVKEACEQSGSHRIADVGSGGGFPGIIEAACLPDYQITLIEPMERRVEWLQEVVDELGLNNVQILRSRSEDLIPKNSRSKKSVNQKHNKVKSQSRKESIDLVSNQEFTPFDVVTCRAVAPLTKLSAWTLPLLKSGGQLVALKGKSAQAEIEKAEKEIRKNGGRNPRVLEAPVAEGLESTYVVVIDKV